MKIQWKKLVFYALIISLATAMGCSSVKSKEDTEYQVKLESFVLTATARSRINPNITSTPNKVNSYESVIPEIEAELREYDIPINTGGIGWINPPVQLIAKENQQLLMKFEYPDIKAGNFVIASDISWETDDQASGCGFTFRVNGEEPPLNQYILIITRMEQGYLLFSALHQGIVANLREVYAEGKDSLFDSTNSATNHLAVVALDSKLYIFLNRSFIQIIDTSEAPLLEPNLPPAPQPNQGSIEPSSQLDELKKSYNNLVQLLTERYENVANTFQIVKPFYSAGYAGLTALNSTGVTTCNFENTWLWITDP